MREISIIIPSHNPGMYPIESAKKSKPVALIDPPTNTILINDRVANIRSLRGFVSRSQDLRKDALVSRAEHDRLFKSKRFANDHSRSSQVESMGEDYIERRAKIDESERQIAEVNISHDGDTTVAVCMALDQSIPEKKLERIIDNGTSFPIHEPQWGDEDWFSNDYFAEATANGEASTDSQEESSLMNTMQDG